MGSRRKRAKRPRTRSEWKWPDPPAHAILLLSPEDEHLRELCIIIPRSNHKRSGVQMYHAVMVYNVDGRRRRRRPATVYKLIMQRVLGVRRLERGMCVDHINGDPLDNRRENLRMATPMQNAANAFRRSGGSSAHKGVYYYPQRRGFKHWRAQLSLVISKGRYTRFNIGTFLTEREAAMAYNEVAREWYGEFARLNEV